MNGHPQYEDDFYGWIQANTLLLRQGNFKEADMDHIIEELEELGRSNKHQLISRLGVLLCHLLKWHYQPELRSSSWDSTLIEQRIQLRFLLEENPSLKSYLNESFIKGYTLGLAKATKETGLIQSKFPTDCPYTLEQCLDEEFYPEGGQ